MSVRRSRLTPREITAALEDSDFGPILTTAELAELLRLRPKTIDDWVAKGRLDGAYRKRGKHRLFWRDRVIDILFNGPEWTT